MDAYVYINMQKQQSKTSKWKVARDTIKSVQNLDLTNSRGEGFDNKENKFRF